VLAIDLETFSSVDLVKSGVYPYAESEDFEILLFAYAFDDETVQVIDLASGEAIPEAVMDALTDPVVIKTAYNAQFERTCLKAHLGMDMPPEQWRCSQVHALTMGLPGHLDAVAKVMGLKEQKMKEGKALIRYFSKPCRATKANEGRTRNLPHHDREKWEQYKHYCKRDVEVEREIRRKLAPFPMTDKEQKLWELDQRINDRGIKLDKVLVEHAIKCDEDYQQKLLKEAINLTELENPNSPVQLKGWLKDKHGVEVESLSKDAVAELLEEADVAEVKQLLVLRQEMSKTSVKKYEAMVRAMRKDERAGGLLQYYGANRTGRWAGRLTNYLKNIRKPEVKTDRFFTTNKTGRVSNNYVNGCIRNAVIKLDWDKEISAHNLRHSFSSNLLEKGASVVSIQKLLGHSNLAVTTRYLHQDKSVLNDAVNLL